MIVKEMKRMALCLFLLLFAGSVWSAAKEDRTEQRVDSVLRLMTLSEKIGQMNQVSSKEDPTGQLTECSNEEELIRSGQVGSMLNVVGVEYSSFAGNRRKRYEVAYTSYICIGRRSWL